MTPKRWQMGGRMLLLAMALMASSGLEVVRAQEAGNGVGAQALLYGQTTGEGSGAISSNLPLYTGGARSALAADDFTIPALGSNTYWLIQSITVYGANNSGSPAINGFNIYVYRDAGNLPGSPVASQFESNISGFGSWDYVINSSLLLPGNQKYWIGIQANIASTGIASWSWQSSSAGGGTSESAWIDYGIQGAGTCFQAWFPRRTVCGIGAQDNMAFQLDGVQVTLPFTTFMPLIRK